ncbi:UNVERIFIED_CONTAM: serine/threonine-protein kinase RsbW [Brevibacillus sp. OAP136]
MNINGSADVIDLTIPARLEYIGVARLLVSGVANRAGLTYDDIEDVKLAVAEACTNAVQHAYLEQEGSIRIQCQLFCDRLLIQVADDGVSFDTEREKMKMGPIDREASIETITEGGLGLFLIHSLMDEVDVRNDQGIVVSMVKYVQRDGVAEDVDAFTRTEI